MNENGPNGRSGAAFNRERLLAFSSLLRKSSREIESCVRGGSMGSVLPEGSRIRIRFSTADSFVAGQIVTYIAKDRLVAHRLVQCATSYDDHYLITRGDATVCCDAPVRTSSVIGIVTEFRNSERWQPVGPPADRGPSSQLMASAISGMVVALLRLNPRFACWIAARMVEIRWAVMRFVGSARRYARQHFSAGAQSTTV
jgi:hypothetical protein